MAAAAHRVVALEAARGIAALIVLFHHFLLGFAPALKVQVAGGPLGFLQNGPAAVTFFFTLSGFVLAIGHLEQPDAVRLAASAVKRWPRLWLPAALSVVLGGLIFGFHLNVDQQQAADLSGSSWLRDSGGGNTTLGGSMLETVTLWFKGWSQYNSSLWTMQWEFFGSYLALGLAGVLARANIRTVLVVSIVAALSLIFLLPFVVPFCFGVALAGIAARTTRRLPPLLAIALLIVGLAALCHEGRIGLFGWTSFVPEGWPYGQAFTSSIEGLGATAVIAALVFAPGLASGLSGRLGRWLGRLSFPIYLVQVAVICTVSSMAYVATAALGTAVQFWTTLAVSFIGAIAFALPFVWVESWWIPLVGRAGRAVVGPSAGSVASP